MCSDDRHRASLRESENDLAIGWILVINAVTTYEVYTTVD